MQPVDSLSPAPHGSVSPSNRNEPNKSSRCGSRVLLAPAEEGPEEIVLEEEPAPLRMAKNPKLPSAEVVEQHNRTHNPYRDWCQWCKMGRGRGQPHTAQPESDVPIVGID